MNVLRETWKKRASLFKTKLKQCIGKRSVRIMCPSTKATPRSEAERRIKMNKANLLQGLEEVG